MKVIDLLNKITNGEEVPKIIKYQGYKWEYSLIENNYIRKCEIVAYRLTLGLDELNDEVEIIEEEKKIPEKINVKGSYNSNKGFEDFNDNEKILVDKINDLLDYLESKEKGE